MLFIAALVRISAWCLQSGSAYYLPPSFTPSLLCSFSQPLSHTPHHAAPSLTLTLSDICFTTYLTSCLCFPFSFSHPCPFSLFCFLKLGSLSSCQPNSFYYHSNPSSPGCPLIVPLIIGASLQFSTRSLVGETEGERV